MKEDIFRVIMACCLLAVFVLAIIGIRQSCGEYQEWLNENYPKKTARIIDIKYRGNIWSGDIWIVTFEDGSVRKVKGKQEDLRIGGSMQIRQAH